MSRTKSRKSDDARELDQHAAFSFQAWWDRWGQTVKILSPYEIAWSAFLAGYHDGRLDTLTVVAPEAVRVTLTEPEDGR